MGERVSRVPVWAGLIVASGIVVGFVYGVAQTLIDEGREPLSGVELVIGVVVYTLVASSLALRPENIVERVIGAAATCVGALWASIGGTLVPYAIGVTEMSVQEFARQINDDSEWWWVFGEAGLGSLVGGAIIGGACGIVAHVAVMLGRRFGLWERGVG